MRGEDRFQCVRAQRIKQWGTTIVEKTKTVRKITEWNFIRMRSKGSPKNK